MKTHSGSSLLILLIMAIGLIAMMVYIGTLQTKSAKPQPSEQGSTASDSLKDRSTTRQWVVQGGGDK